MRLSCVAVAAAAVVAAAVVVLSSVSGGGGGGWRQLALSAGHRGVTGAQTGRPAAPSLIACRLNGALFVPCR